ncbi:MAG TPA: N-formylglutamate amidohydrolase [Candidatus Eisenbacteria bacterium]|nr:N-formylglutamate amidohydrolase [Candidatus Eisenbacteria bacterium]
MPIILSAPHGGREPIPHVAERSGNGIRHFNAGRDHRTDRLAERIAAQLRERLGESPFVVIARFERKFLDLNRPPAAAYECRAVKPYYDAYHDALAAACRRVKAIWGRGLLLDIHGHGADAETIYRGTANGKTVEFLLERFGLEALSGARSVLGYLERKGYRVSPAAGSDRELRYVGGHIVQTYGSHRGTAIDAIQLEFGTRLRNESNLGRVAADVAEAIAVFAQNYLPLLAVVALPPDQSVRR